MRFLDKIFGKKKKAEEKTIVEELGKETGWETEPAIIEAIQEMVEVIPSLVPPSPPPKRIISDDVKLKKSKKRKKKKTTITKKRSENKMLPEIKYEYVQCDCPEWKTHLPQIVEQQQYAVNRGRKENIDLAYQIKPFVFCPWCGYKRYRSNRGKKASKQ